MQGSAQLFHMGFVLQVSRVPESAPKLAFLRHLEYHPMQQVNHALSCNIQQGYHCLPIHEEVQPLFRQHVVLKHVFLCVTLCLASVLARHCLIACVLLVSVLACATSRNLEMSHSSVQFLVSIANPLSYVLKVRNQLRELHNFAYRKSYAELSMRETLVGAAHAQWKDKPTSHCSPNKFT